MHCGVEHEPATARVEMTVTPPPTTKPRFSRCFFTSGLPPIFLMVFGSPTVANDNGIIGSLRSPKILVIANQLGKRKVSFY